MKLIIDVILTSIWLVLITNVLVLGLLYLLDRRKK